MSKLYLFRGLPGSSKTSAVPVLLPGVAHFENDMWFMKNGQYVYQRDQMPQAIDWCMDNVKNCLERGIDVVVSNTFTKRRFVNAYRAIAEEYGADFKVYRMMGDFKNVHNVPENILKNMKENFDDYEGELFVYPNLNQSKDDPCYRPYMITSLKVGDRIEVLEKTATITDIRQGTYDYLNVFYKEDDTGEEYLCMSGDCKKIES